MAFRVFFTNIVMLHCFIFPSVMPEDSKAKEFSGIHFGINNRSSNDFITFCQIQKQKPDLCHLIPSVVILPHLIPGCVRNQFLYLPPTKSRSKSRSPFFIFNINIMLKETFYRGDNDAYSDLILISDSIDIEVYSSLPAQQTN